LWLGPFYKNRIVIKSYILLRRPCASNSKTHISQKKISKIGEGIESLQLLVERLFAIMAHDSKIYRRHETDEVGVTTTRGDDRACHQQADLHRIETALVPLASTSSSNDQESNIRIFYFVLGSTEPKPPWPAPSLYVSKRRKQKNLIAP
jgi:hypothetical protein